MGNMSFSGMESPPADSYSGSQDRGTSVIDQNSEVEGTYNTTRDLRIEGRLSGSVNCDGVLFIAAGAEVDAAVEAASIIVSGHLRGQIRCRGRLEITSSGSVGGEVETATLVIVEGARYEGRISMQSSQVEDSTGQAEANETSASEPPDTYSLLRRYASVSPESTDESPDEPAMEEDENQ
jgi:cytoskeletal protein CcmA (bactofilin family)